MKKRKGLLCEPEGLKFVSPGRSPGYRIRPSRQALKGRYKSFLFKVLCRPYRAQAPWDRIPGALPRAFEFEPFGLEDVARWDFFNSPLKRAKGV